LISGRKLVVACRCESGPGSSGPQDRATLRPRRLGRRAPVRASTRAGILDDYAEHLQQRWAAGATDAVALTAEITALGYRGSAKTVRRYLQPLRSAQPATPRPPTPPTTRDATGWLTRHPDSLTDDERAARDAVLDRSPGLRATRDQVSEFAEILPSAAATNSAAGCSGSTPTAPRPFVRHRAWTVISSPSPPD